MEEPVSLMLFRLVAIGAWLVFSAARIRAEEPWSVRVGSPVMEAPAPDPGFGRPAVPDGFVKTACFIWLRAYQTGLGRLVASQCPMKPSCSNYSLEAISKYGGFWGILMTADRLFHEGSAVRTAPWMVEDGRIRFFDPVEENVIWRETP
jgi:uncharacterized protein